MMTKEEKRELYKPKWWAVYENGTFIGAWPSHKAAKAAMHRKIVEAEESWLDAFYEIKPYENVSGN